MAIPLRYGEPDWNRPPRQGIGLSPYSEILEQPLSNKSYEELRYEATQKQWANKFVDLNTMAVSSGADSSFVNLKNLTEVVEVLVGEDDQQARWVVHQKLLTTDSDFAALALKTGFKEHDERVIRFPEESLDVFEQYVKYLYTGCILTFSLELVVQMYTLGDRLQSMKFANACYETIAKSTDPYSAKQIKYIFDNTYPEDRLRKLCTSQVSKGILAGRYSFSTPDEQELLKEFMSGFMQGVITAVAEMRRGGEKWFPSFSFAQPAANPATATTNPTPAPTPAASVPVAPRLFGTDPIPSSGSGGLFGNNNNTHGTSSSQTTGSLFGSVPSTSAPFGGGLFGQPATAAGGSAFGATNSNPGGFGSVKPVFGGVPFGATSQPSTGFGSGVAPSGSAFGVPSQPPSGSTTSGWSSILSGGNPHASTASTGGLFGTAPTQSANNTGGLFRAVGTNPPAVGGSPFGGNPQPASAFGGGTRSASGGLFSNTTTNPSGDSPFGRPTSVSPFGTYSHPPATIGRSSLFGSQQPSSTSGGLFGNAQTSNSGLFGSAQPRTSGLFGAPTQPPATSSFEGFAFGRPTSAPPSGSLFGQPSQSQSLQDSSNNTQNANQQSQPTESSHHATSSTDPVSPARPAENSTSTTNTANNNTESANTVTTPGDKINGAGNTHPGTANTNPNPLPLNGSSTTSPFAPSWPVNAAAPPSSSYPSLPVFSPFTNLKSDPKLRTGRNDSPGLHVPVSHPASAGSAANGQNIIENGNKGSGAGDRFTPTAPSLVVNRNEMDNDLEEIDEDMTKALMNMTFPSSSSSSGAQNGEKAESTAIGGNANGKGKGPQDEEGNEYGGDKWFSAKLAAIQKSLEESTATVKAQLEKSYISGSYTPLKSGSSETITGTGISGEGGSAPATTAADAFEPANSTAAGEQGGINREGESEIRAASEKLNAFGARFI